MPPGPAVSLRDLLHRYRGAERPTLDIERLDVEEGSAVALIGASGAGKSSLLRLIDGRLGDWEGSASVLGHALAAGARPPRAWRREVGFVFQEFALVEQVSVFRNVLNGRLGRSHVGRSLLGRFAPDDLAAAQAALRDVGLTELAERRVDRLSGGQRQRVALARALAQEPRLLIADEPVSNLDPVTSASILDLLRESARTRGVTLILSSHQPHLVAAFVDRFVALDRGRVVFDGEPRQLDEDRLATVYGPGGLDRGHQGASS